VPLLGGLMMFGIFIKAAIFYGHSVNDYSKPVLGISVPIIIGIGGLLLGFVFMAAQWAVRPDFFRRRPQTADPAILEAHLSHTGP